MSVTFANVQTQISQRFSLAAPMSRREIFLWVTVALLANEIFQLVDAQSPYSFVESLGNQNFILWLAGYAFVFRLWVSSRDRPADRLDFWFAAATCLAILITSLVPHRWGIGLVATTTAAYLLLTHRGDRNLRAGGCVLLAMSTHLVWGPIIFLLVTPEVVQGDAFAVAGILKVLRPDIIWRDTTFYTPDGHGLILIGACSSFQNVSTALLACATVAMLSRTEWRSRDIITIALAALAMVFINTVRLCLIAWSGPLFKYWHDGYGVTIFIFSETVIVLLIAWRGAAAGGHEK